MSVGTPSAGGYAVPTLLDPTFVITGPGAIDPLRKLATIKTTTPNNWHGITAGQITASWDTEASAVSDDAPTLTSPSITPYLGRAYIPMSFEAWDDIDNLASEVAKLFADAKTNLEATTFATNTGSSAPKGVSYAVGAVTTSRVSPTTGGTYGLPDIYAVQNALPERFSRGASWLASLTILNKTRRTRAAPEPGSSRTCSTSPPDDHQRSVVFCLVAHRGRRDECRRPQSLEALTVRDRAEVQHLRGPANHEASTA